MSSSQQQQQQEAGAVTAGEQQHQRVQSPESDSSANTPSHPTLSPEAIQSSQEHNHNHNNHHSSRRDFAKMRRPSSPNASSAPITQASGAYTGGVVNRHPNSDAVQQEHQTAGDHDNSSTSAAATATPTSAQQHDAGSGGNAASTTTTSEPITFRVGVSEDRNQKCRRTMEDSHAFVYDFGGVQVGHSFTQSLSSLSIL